jgi:hypothetical protein
MTPQQQLLLLAGLAAGLAAAAMWVTFRVMNDPAKRERKRRLQVNRSGRLAEALITEVSEDLLHYTYILQGVQYGASQDIRTLRDLLPQDLNQLIGHARIKYLPKNPANSILLCEEWNGTQASLRTVAGVSPEAAGRR